MFKVRSRIWTSQQNMFKQSFCTHHSPDEGWREITHVSPVRRATADHGLGDLTAVSASHVVTLKRRRTFSGPYNDDAHARELFTNLDMPTQEMEGLFSQTTRTNLPSRRKKRTRTQHEWMVTIWSERDPTDHGYSVCFLAYRRQILWQPSCGCWWENPSNQNWIRRWRDRKLRSQRAFSGQGASQLCTRCTSAKKNGFHTCRVVERHDDPVTGSEHVHGRAARAGHVGNSDDEALPTGQRRQFVELTNATSKEAEWWLLEAHNDVAAAVILFFQHIEEETRKGKVIIARRAAERGLQILEVPGEQGNWMWLVVAHQMLRQGFSHTHQSLWIITADRIAGVYREGKSSDCWGEYTRTWGSNQSFRTWCSIQASRVLYAGPNPVWVDDLTIG